MWWVSINFDYIVTSSDGNQFTVHSLILTSIFLRHRLIKFDTNIIIVHFPFNKLWKAFIINDDEEEEKRKVISLTLTACLQRLAVSKQPSHLSMYNKQLIYVKIVVHYSEPKKNNIHQNELLTTITTQNKKKCLRDKLFNV